MATQPLVYQDGKLIDKDTQQVCVDLPGEIVRCWRSTTNVEVLLRKHRDVIFDIRLGNGKSYTVEATESDFYNARDKKIVFQKRQGKVSFKDGERLHLWVSRGFRGALLVKCGTEVILCVEPNELDKHQLTDDPKEKPAPIIIAIGESNKNATAPQGALKPSHPAGTKPAPVPDKQVHVTEVRPSAVSTPQAVLDFFKHGGEETAIDAEGVLTRNWLWAQIAGSAAYVGDNVHWIRELWRQKFYIKKIQHKTGVKAYIIFKGSPQLREFLTAAKYSVMNPKVLAIGAGAGSAAAMRHASWDSAKGTFKGAAGVAVVFTIALSVAEWLRDYEQRDPKTGKPKKDFIDLFVKVGIDLAKIGIGAAATSLLVAAFIGLGVLSGGAAIVLGTIFFAGLVGVGLEVLDKKTGFSEVVTKKVSQVARYLEQKMPKDYEAYEGSLHPVLMP